MKAFEAIGLTACGALAGGFLIWGVDHLQRQAATYGFVHGACGSDLSDCYGYVEYMWPNGSKSYRYQVKNGFVFGFSEKPGLITMIDRNCLKALGVSKERLPTCKFIRAAPDHPNT